ncbi:transcriptional regulator, IclR family [Agreia bicolorata]|uniref:Transcriptional regulator, IclR family n=1 Tax=Agreia bicolorata TaxID=110935 RepID=A0A1T4XIY3_9MICO|nr:IclR family transcriptional regulator [Agreia bicolorata]SKA89373.1 transcriptional regulator, IclR family [Agreia bicolorata]
MTLTPEETTTAKPVKSAERTLQLLETIASAGEPMPVTELHSRTGFPRSSLHQLLHTMAAAQWVQFSSDKSLVAIGTRALVVGTSYLDRDAALPLAAAMLERVRSESGYTAHYARRDRDNVLYLATRETSESHRAASRVGRLLPANATALGKALLAELSDAEREAVMGREAMPLLTAHTITDPIKLGLDLETARSAGFAIEREENTLGVSCVAAAVPYRIPATDAISCSIPLDRADPTEMARVAAIVRRCASDLAEQLRTAGVR